MSQLARRTLATVSHAGPSMPSSIALTAPQAVRKRREQAELNANPPGSIPRLTRQKTPRDLSPRLEAEFQALRARGQYKGDEASGRKVFFERQVQWRSRLRGVKVEGSRMGFLAREALADGDAPTKSPTGTASVSGAVPAGSNLATGAATGSAEIEREGSQSVTDIVAQRIYLPNIQIRLMRNHTPPGEAYDPNVATFRIPHSMTKTDLRSYLMALYSLNPTFIRTDNYFAPVKRMAGGQVRTQIGSVKSYKRAVIGLSEPFHYPDDVDELYAQGAENGTGSAMGDERKQWIEDNFLVEQMKEYRKKALMKFHKGYRWRGKTHDNQGNVMREIMKKREAKEAQLRAEVAKMKEEGRLSAQSDVALA